MGPPPPAVPQWWWRIHLLKTPKSSSPHVPGTARLYDDNSLPASTAQRTHLKHGRDNILLVPWPSNSPNDPLNWPLWKRDLTLFILCFCSATPAIVGPAVAGVLVKEFHTSYSMVSRWSGWQFWASGIASLIASAVSDWERSRSLDEMKQPATSAQTETKKKFLEELSLYNGRFSSEPLYKSLLAPFVLFLYPATLWSFLFQRTFITSFILAQLFTGPPYNTQLGYMYAAPFIGAIVSYFAAGVFSDFLTKFMARRNNNIYEPELRILLVIPVAIVALPGIYAFGYTTEVAASSRLAS
ncbi:hypothetical protein FN846DRAFT_908060 [Sphaerosporella brunnea]|uniref:Major facilitator superfamily domain-containing protein n=1 Tax=Sphaerosporella brunnea TaxID=1250544 RepID=A0A5J5EUB8_9PEZI|nr:hypothetical protein FN846DRAFT_908060 [Sphaerosporella brunnea]